MMRSGRYKLKPSKKKKKTTKKDICILFFFFGKPAKPTGPLLKLKRNNQGTSKTTNWAMSEGKSPSHSLVSVKHLAFLANASATTLQAR